MHRTVPIGSALLTRDGQVKQYTRMSGVRFSTTYINDLAVLRCTKGHALVRSRVQSFCRYLPLRAVRLSRELLGGSGMDTVDLGIGTRETKGTE